jgi:hypothetical protein
MELLRERERGGGRGEKKKRRKRKKGGKKEGTVTFALYDINNLVCITEVETVFTLQYTLCPDVQQACFVLSFKWLHTLAKSY